NMLWLQPPSGSDDAPNRRLPEMTAERRARWTSAPSIWLTQPTSNLTARKNTVAERLRRNNGSRAVRALQLSSRDAEWMPPRLTNPPAALRSQTVGRLDV